MEVNPKHSISIQFKKKAAAHKPDKTVNDLLWLLFHTALKQTVPDQSRCYMDLSFIEEDGQGLPKTTTETALGEGVSVSLFPTAPCVGGLLLPNLLH